MRGTSAVKRFTPAQREACYRLRLEGWTAKAAAELLTTAGFGNVDAFEITPASVLRIAKELGDTRQPTLSDDIDGMSPTAAVDVLAADAIRLAQARFSAMRTKEARGKLTDAALTEHLRMLKAARELAAKCAQSPTKTLPKQGTNGVTDNGQDAADDLAWLADEPAKHRPKVSSPTDKATAMEIADDKGNGSTASAERDASATDLDTTAATGSSEDEQSSATSPASMPTNVLDKGTSP